MKFTTAFKSLILFLLVIQFSHSVSAQIKILSGVKGGSYNLLANDIKDVSEAEIEVMESEGSASNFKELINDSDIKITFLQYDVLIFYKDLEDPDKTDDVRILMPLPAEEIHLVTLSDSPINSLKDLEGKRVAIGSPEQGTNVTAKLIKRETGIKWIDVESSFNNAFGAIMMEQADAFFFVGAAPVGKLNELSSKSKNLVKLIQIQDNRLDKIYKAVTIKKGTYSWVTKDTKTYTVRSVLAANIKKETKEDKKELKKMLKSIKKDFAKLQKEGHSKWKEIKLDFKEIDWPVHELAKKIF